MENLSNHYISSWRNILFNRVLIFITGFTIDISQKEASILALFEGLSKRQENVLRMYFGLGGKHKTTLEKIGHDLDLRVEDVLQIKNEGIREFIKLIVSTGILGDKDKSFSDEFIESSDAEFLDEFMMKFIA